MKLDDRPVIDQLTEPLPLNHVQDVEAVRLFADELEARL